MGLVKWLEERMKVLNMWDIAFVKWSAILFGIIIGAYISDFAKRYVWIILVLALLLALRPIVKVFKK